MATRADAAAQPRTPLSRERVLRAAIDLADGEGVGSLSMRKLAAELGVVPMALYKHVANKDELLDGMIDVIVGEIDPPIGGTDWKAVMRARVLSARRVLLRHPWASRVIETRTNPTPAVLAYIDSMIGIFLAGGFSADLTHHAVHTMGSRLYGFTQEVFDDGGDASRAMDPATLPDPSTYRNIAAMVTGVAHDEGSVVGPGCDDQFEFEFALDLLLDGLDRLREGN